MLFTSLHDAVEARLRTDAQRIVYRWIGRSGDVECAMTGDELRHRAGAMARHLRALRPEGGIVGLAGSPGPDFLVGLLGSIFAGMTALPLPGPGPGPARHRLKAGIEALSSGLLIASATEADALRAIAHGADLVIPGTDWAKPPRYAPPEVALLQFTSGTTRQARAVRLTGSAILANAAFTAGAWQSTPEDTSLTWLPHYHDMGLFGGLLYPLLTGMGIAQMAPLSFVQRPQRWLEAISLTRATITGAPAFALQLCRDSISTEAMHNVDLGCLRALYCGSEPIPPGLLAAFSQEMRPAGLRLGTVFACYGMAETTLFAAGTPKHAETESCALHEDGQHQLAIFDNETERFVDAGSSGEILLLGPSLCSGYTQRGDDDLFWSDPETGCRWLRTGDLGKISEGRLTITGRAKDVLIVNGTNIAATEIEWAAARTDPALNPLAAAAFATGPIASGQSVLVIETLRKMTTSPTGELITRIRALLQSTFGIDLRAVRVVRPGTLERTTSGKIRRASARIRFESGDFDGGIT